MTAPLKRLAWCILACALVVGCEDKIKPSVVPVPQSEMPSQESWNSTVIFSDSAKVKAILWAGHIAVYSQQRFTLLDDSIHVDFYDEMGEHTSSLTARRGKVNDVTEDFEAHDHVVVVSDSGTVLHTDELYWNNAERKIHTDAFVDIVSPTERIMGQGMVSDQSLKNYKIFRVTGKAITHE
jgi:LPS export ABC transporter protein LptC